VALDAKYPVTGLALVYILMKVVLVAIVGIRAMALKT
jgi:hypothetical protein